MNPKDFVEVEDGIEVRFSEDYTKLTIYVQDDNRKLGIIIPVMEASTKLLIESQQRNS